MNVLSHPVVKIEIKNLELELYVKGAATLRVKPLHFSTLTVMLPFLSPKQVPEPSTWEY